MLRGCIQGNICGKILCRGEMLREHVKSERGNTVGKYFADHQLTMGSWKWGAWTNHHPVFTAPFSLSHDDHTDLQMLLSTHLMMMI